MSGKTRSRSEQIHSESNAADTKTADVSKQQQASFLLLAYICRLSTGVFLRFFMTHESPQQRTIFCASNASFLYLSILKYLYAPQLQCSWHCSCGIPFYYGYYLIWYLSNHCVFWFCLADRVWFQAAQFTSCSRFQRPLSSGLWSLVGRWFG